jgi:hypothetical protein
MRVVDSKYPILPYMLRPKEQTYITEAYVSSPPALIVVDEEGAVWTLGNKLQMGPRGEYAFDILRDGVDTGEVASRIERREGKIRIFTLNGWKRWNTKWRSFF